jgi:hypothetical protein
MVSEMVSTMFPTDHLATVRSMNIEIKWDDAALKRVLREVEAKANAARSQGDRTSAPNGEMSPARHRAQDDVAGRRGSPR